MRINNINKKVFASLLSFTMITTSVSGCAETKAQSKLQEDDTISYDSLTGCYKIVELDVMGETKIYLARESINIPVRTYNPVFTYYYDAFSNTLLYSEKNGVATTNDSNVILVSKNNVKDYLLHYDMLQESYTSEELEELLDKIKEDRKEKVLVK